MFRRKNLRDKTKMKSKQSGKTTTTPTTARTTTTAMMTTTTSTTMRTTTTMTTTTTTSTMTTITKDGNHDNKIEHNLSIGSFWSTAN